ncbi:MAG: LOG family protein [Anaerolineales bacterium]|nr:LOG family protein [Anaerolineales bacterium]
MKHVTIFGGSQPLPGDPIYEEALQLGRLCAAAGYTVVTGGYMGVMEAASRGAREAGGYVIGVTCAQIEAWRPRRANPWVVEERRYPTLQERQAALLSLGDAAIALPGGVGTLAEIAMLWSHVSVGAMPSRPLILVGGGWREVLGLFFDRMGALVPTQERERIIFAEEAEAAVDRLQQAWSVSRE